MQIALSSYCKTESGELVNGSVTKKLDNCR